MLLKFERPKVELFSDISEAANDYSTKNHILELASKVLESCRAVLHWGDEPPSVATDANVSRRRFEKHSS